MKKELCTIKTETLAAALADARELETRLSGIFTQFGGINIRSIIRLIHDFGTQVNVNGDLFWEQSLYADSPDFHWDGTPGKVDSVRLLEYKHLAYINLRPLAGDRARYITSFDIGYETDEEPSAGEVTENDIVEEINSRIGASEPTDAIFGLIDISPKNDFKSHKDDPAYRSAGIRFLEKNLPGATFIDICTDQPSETLDWVELYFSFEGRDYRLDFNRDIRTQERSFEIAERGDNGSFEDYAGITPERLYQELKSRKPTVPPEIVKKATELFAELNDLVTSNNFSLCFDNDTDCLFIGPNKIAWNVDRPSEEYGDPSVRKPVTSDMIDRYSKDAHIATEPFVFMHSSDSDDTFARCGLTYLP